MRIIKYKKLLLLLLTFVVAYFIFSEGRSLFIHQLLLQAGYLGTLIAGGLFVYGFTAAPATAILLILSKQQNILLAGLVGGFGALIGDLLIFQFIRHSFSDEIKELSKEPIFKEIKTRVPPIVRNYLAPVLGGIIIASPLPDEIGISLLATSTISTRTFAILSFLLNTAGIFAILLVGIII